MIESEYLSLFYILMILSALIVIIVIVFAFNQTQLHTFNKLLLL